ncbi:hypothetical protein DIE03_03155 [Burkholderia sp. Bp8992]|uniref:hypothetical protein n=1 Tax=Burkholderia sp. Bp8992 TaxID=2184554 RepID=UPI000F561462|nr:hypothetical protein [Burkholderia sp. Bp8992]RQS36164.1 hypothetical protein DIE03_03155 [Burkholderia sp. Bp8992]
MIELWFQVGVGEVKGTECFDYSLVAYRAMLKCLLNGGHCMIQLGKSAFLEQGELLRRIGRSRLRRALDSMKREPYPATEQDSSNHFRRLYQ